MNALRGAVVQKILRQFDYGGLPAGLPRGISSQAAGLAMKMAEALGDGTELRAGLLCLLEARDCFLRQVTADKRAGSG